MDEQNKKRMKIKIRILCGIVVIFVITGIAYAFTLNRYLNQNNRIKENVIPMQTESVTETVAATEPESIPEETQETEPVVPKELTFKETCAENYTDEMSQTELTYLSDTTYIAVFQNEINGNPYTLAHVVIKSPNQISTTVSKTRRLSIKLYEDENALLAMSSSMLAGHINFMNGLHITNSETISSNQIPIGTELACDTSGTLYKMQPDTPTDNIAFTILSDTPLLIQNNEAVQIPDAIAPSKTCKSAIGMVKPCEYYFLTASDGDYINDITYADIQSILLEKNCSFAQSLTKDVNVAMAFKGELVNRPADKSGRTQYEYLIIKD